MPSPSAALGQAQSARHSLLQPHEHNIHRASFETLTSVASSNPDHRASTQLRSSSSARQSTYSSASSEHYPPHPRNPRPRQALEEYQINRSPTAGLPPLRDLPPLLPPREEVHDPLAEPYQLEESLAAEEMIPAGLDLALGKLYGFPYCMGVPDAMEQRAAALAEAEELEYQRERKQRARLSGRMSSAFKSVSWSRRGQR